MTTIEELEQRKKELQLRSEIAKLERGERAQEAQSRISSWSWWWVAPLGVVSAVLLMGGLDTSQPSVILAGVVLSFPVILKLRNRMGK